MCYSKKFQSSLFYAFEVCCVFLLQHCHENQNWVIHILFLEEYIYWWKLCGFGIKHFNYIYINELLRLILISWLQSPSAVILELPKIKSDTVSTVLWSVFLTYNLETDKLYSFVYWANTISFARNWTWATAVKVLSPNLGKASARWKESRPRSF